MQMKNYIKLLFLGLSIMIFDIAKAPRTVDSQPPAGVATPPPIIHPFFCQNPMLDLSGRSADDIFNLYRNACDLHCDRAYFLQSLHPGVDDIKLAEGFAQSTRIKRFFEIISTVKLKPIFTTIVGPFIPIMTIKSDPNLLFKELAETMALGAYFSAKILSFLEKNKNFLIGCEREHLREQIMFFAIQSEEISFEDFINFIKIQDELRKDLPQGSFETTRDLLTTNENSERMNLEAEELSARSILCT